ncbi:MULTISPECIES: amino acid ABC transporter permease [Mesorhizobium]|uniref:amino acid ABC transporter permease n=1 Tax=Mesorhizobium TaxID=68287 RepID=UPI0010A966B2|nr:MULTISPECIES: amino acid ABC transporter permease [Mesorhizobium]
MTETLQTLLTGVPWTIAVTSLAFAIGAVLGIPLVLMRRSKSFLLRLLSRTVIDVLRGIPPIVWLFILFFGIGTSAVELNPFEASVIGLGLVSAAYLAEIYRSGFLAVHFGQAEAATALGMSKPDALALILAPQVMRVAIPPATTYLISLLKDSAVASTIGVSDISFRAFQHAQSSGGGLTPFMLAAVLYILLSIPVVWLSRSVDARLRKRVSR